MLDKIIGGGIGVAAALALSASSVQAQNLLDNPSFESAFITGGGAGGSLAPADAGLGWDNNFGGSAQAPNDMSSSSDSPYDGSYVLLGANAAGNAWNPQGTYQLIANSSVGDAWSASIWALTDTGPLSSDWTTPVDLQVQFLDGSLNNISTADLGWSAIAANDTWQQYNLSGIVPAGTEYISVYAFAMVSGDNTGTVNVYFDDASLTATPEPTTLAIAGVGLVSSFFLIRRRNS